MSDIKSLLQEGGIVGAGGAGFPSYAKIAEGANLLIINGAECEPLIYTDLHLLKDHLQTVIDGINVILDGAGIEKCYIAVKNHTAERLGMSDWQPLTERIRVRTLPDAYPMGDEINMIYEVTGKVVAPGALPITLGIIVYNVETVYNAARACKGMPLTEKWLTVGGDIKNRKVLRVPVGMRIRELFEKLGVTVPSTHVVIDGGPSMGKVINHNSAVITKTTKSLLILPKDIPAVRGKISPFEIHSTRASSNCCQCTRCTDMCPRALLGYPLEPHRLVRTVTSVAEENPEIIKTASLCCGCGICEIAACCQAISPKAVIDNLKGVLAKNKMRYTSNETPKVSEHRDYRLVPSERWKMMLGVHKMDDMPEFTNKKLGTSHVELLLRQNIGAPVTPTVKVGDKVSEGQVIGTCDGGLYVPLHASVSGEVTAVDSTKIIIESTEAR